MVRLSYEIRRQRVPVADIAEFMRQHPEWATQPADGQPLLWNPNARELRLRTLVRQAADRRFSTRVWESPAGR